MVGDRGRGSEDPPAVLLFSQRYQAEINDLENLGEMGSGTCGQVWKMRFRKTGHIIAVKVSLPRPSSRMHLCPCSLPHTQSSPLDCSSLQQMRRSGNKEENKRILMDLDVVLKSHDCPYIVQCFGTFITNVSTLPGGPSPSGKVSGHPLPHRALTCPQVPWCG